MVEGRRGLTSSGAGGHRHSLFSASADQMHLPVVGRRSDTKFAPTTWCAPQSLAAGGQHKALRPRPPVSRTQQETAQRQRSATRMIYDFVGVFEAGLELVLDGIDRWREG